MNKKPKRSGPNKSRRKPLVGGAVHSPLNTHHSSLLLKGRVFDIQRFSLHDGPGIRTTVFLKGCALRCFWCQNPEGLAAAPELMFTAAFCVGCGACVSVCPTKAHALRDGRHFLDRGACTVCGRCARACPAQALRIVGREMTVREVAAAVGEDEPYYRASGGGVTLSGGEPLCQPDFAAALLAECRRGGFHTALDTALDAEWEAVERVLPHVDLLLADLKTCDSAKHRQATGSGNERILANYARLGACSVPVVVRVPIIPGVNDTADDVSAIAEFAARNPDLQYIELLPHHRLGEAKREGLGLPPPQRPLPNIAMERLRLLAAAAAGHGVRVRGPGLNETRPTGRTSASGSANRARREEKLETRNQKRETDSARYERRLEAIRRRKLEHTAAKRQAGPRDVDDWGQIPLEGLKFRFAPETDHPKGYVLGPRACGSNFRRFLQACPAYVDPMSSLLGGYYVTFDQYVTGWDPEAFWSHLAQDIEKYGIIDGIGNTQHFLSDVRIGLELGFGGLLAKIARFRRMAKNKAAEKQAFYDGLAEFARGVQDWIGNHVAAARALAARESDPLLRRNLEEMAEINTRLATAPPATFREACQWLAWYQMAKRSYIGGGPLGRLDQILYPYYQRDAAAGRLTDEEAVFHLACLLAKDSHYIQLGGVDPQGRDTTNPLSFLFLEAAHQLKIPANIAVAVHEAMDPKLLRRAVELLCVDKLGIPRFAGVAGIVNGLVRAGWPVEVARQRVQAGCHWFGLPGREYCFNDTIKINFAKLLEVAIGEMMSRGEPSLARLWKLFDAHLRRAVEVVALGLDYHMEHQHRFYPELALSLLCHGPIEQGVDASHGSLEYTYVGVDGAALATAADSFAALEQRVEAEDSVTWNELFCALKHNWWRAGRLRMMVRGVPGYGRGGTRGDFWAARISKRFSELVAAKPTPAGHRLCPGLFSWASVLSMGRQTGATPDGRGAGEPISFGANPNPERTRGGTLVPTTMSTAVARVQPGYGNPAPLQLDIDPGLVANEDGIEKLAALVRTHFALGGTLINANVLDRQRVLDACRHPEKHPDLLVRVTGFSAYLASLSPEFRKLVYERIVALEEATN